MEDLFKLGASCFGCDLYFKSEPENAEHNKERIISLIKSTMFPMKSDAEYRLMARETLGLRGQTMDECRDNAKT